MNKKVLGVVFFILTALVFVSVATAGINDPPIPEVAISKEGGRVKEKNTRYGYIVRLSEKSIAGKSHELEEKIRQQRALLRKTRDRVLREQIQQRISTLTTEKRIQLKAYKVDLIARQTSAIDKIRRVAPFAKIKKKYFTAFNGFLVEANEQDIKKIKALDLGIEPNEEVTTLLNDSVPLLNAENNLGGWGSVGRHGFFHACDCFLFF